MESQWHGTTILGVRHGGVVALGGDGQVTFGTTVIKSGARKLRTLAGGRAIAGFAGATADAMALFERLEAKIEQYSDLTRASVELVKDWRTDRNLRRLNAMLAVADRSVLLLVSGEGDVLEPEHGVLGIGSGGPYAVAAARALIADGKAELSAREILTRSLSIAAEICIYTNDRISIEELDCT